MLALINDTGILVVLAAIMLLFGASQIPKLARNLGEASKEFKKAHDDAARPPAQPAAALGPAPVSGSAAPEDTITISRTRLDALLASNKPTDRVV